MNRKTIGPTNSLRIAIALVTLCGATARADKTLVSWVTLANTTQQGGSALTLQSGDRFDAIVIGEKEPGKWMAGSEFFHRLQPDQHANPAETANPDTLIRMTYVYQENRISIYRNDARYASYETHNIDLLGAPDAMVVFGIRHWGATTGQTFHGTIQDARIYDMALSEDEIRKLEPGKESARKPYAWWNFAKGRGTDAMGKFPVNTLIDGAKIEGGRLVLNSDGATLIASAKSMPIVTGETPYMPADPPANWLTYHLVHPGPGDASPGDPNCAFYWNGKYHLHYIYNHQGFNFAHVTSDDMVHWTWQPSNLKPKFTGHGMFSGTGFFTKDGKPAIIYHGWGSNHNQIATAADDNLESWNKPWPLEPIIKPGQDGSKIANWDPDAWLEGNTYYALSGGNPGSGKPPTLFRSDDLKNWDYLGLFLTKDMPDVRPDEDISCLNFFKIGNKRMLLCISHNLGCRYYLGEWKNERFTPDFHARMTWNGNHFFAPESLLTKDGRRVMWAWIMGLPLAPTGVQSLPRELELPADGILRIKPLRELESLRYDPQQQNIPTLKGDMVVKPYQSNGDALELQVTFKTLRAKELGVDLLYGAGDDWLRIAYLPDRNILQVGAVNAPFELKMGANHTLSEDLNLRIFLDKNLVEVFANDRQAAVAAAKYEMGNPVIDLRCIDAEPTAVEIKSWKMKSIYQKSATGSGRTAEH